MSLKSDIKKVTVRFFMAAEKCLSAPTASLPFPSGRRSKMSRTILRTWLFPLAGGMNFSIRSVNRIAPTLSLFPMALNASTAASSVSKSFCVRVLVPPDTDGLTSTIKMTVSSRSSSKTLTWGMPVRAVTFQSMARTSSPAWYSRFSRNAMPRPLNAL